MIEVKTILNEPLVRKFNEYQTKKNIWVSFVAMAVLVIIGIVCLFDDDLGLPFAIPVIALGLLLPVLFVFLTRFMIKRMLKNSPALQNETTQIFRFAEDSIMLNESSKYVQAKDVQISYDAIIKAVEREDAFYLSIAKSQAYILDAKGFRMGSRRDLHDFLLNKFGNRFHFKKSLYAKK